MKKRIICMLLALATLVNSLPFSMLSAKAETELSDEELYYNYLSVKDKVEEDGYEAEYTLFTGVLDDYYSDDEIRSIYSLSADDMEQILGWLRKYVQNGAENGYSDTSAVTKFMKNESWFILEYFVNGEYAGGIVPQNETFTTKLPDYYWFKNEADIPDTITFSVQVNSKLSAEDVKWVVAGYSYWGCQNYIDNDNSYKISTTAFNSELTLTAEDFLNCTSPSSEWEEYHVDTVAVYAVCNDTMSNVCYVNIGGDVAVLNSAGFGAVDSGAIEIELSGADKYQLNYSWSDYYCDSLNNDDLMLQNAMESQMLLSKESVLTLENTENFENLCLLGCTIKYNDEDGLEHIIPIPAMPVCLQNNVNSELEEHLYTPVTCFIGDYNATHYAIPGSSEEYKFFTLADDSELYTRWYDDDNVYGEGGSFTLPAEWAEIKRYCYVDACAKAPSGKEYTESIWRNVGVMAEGEAYDFFSNTSLRDKNYDCQLVVGENSSYVEVVSLADAAVLYNGDVYRINSYSGTAYWLKAHWYINSVPQYTDSVDCGTYKSSYNNVVFNLDTSGFNFEDSLQLYWYFCLETQGGDVVYTSDIYLMGLNRESSVDEEPQYYITEDGTLYSVLSTAETIDVPETVDGIAVKAIGPKAFANCKNVETINLPASLVEVCDDAFVQQTQTIKNIHFQEGIVSIGFDAFPDTMETLNFPSTLKKVGDFPYNTVGEVTLGAFSDCTFENENYADCIINAEKVIFEEGITEIGNKKCGCRINADEVVLPSTLKTLAPENFWSVGTMNFPEGLESIDLGGCIVSDDYGYTDYESNVTLEMTEITIPNSVKKISSLGSIYNAEIINIPEGIEAWEGMFAETNIETYTFPAGTTKIPKGCFFCTSNLKTVIIPEGVTEICDYAFYGSSIDTIVLPSTLKTIGNYAFQGSSIQNIIIPDGVTSIGNGVFKECGNLSSVTLPKNMTTIPTETFYSCSALAEINFPKTVSRIGAKVFANSGLCGEVTLPAGLISIAYGAFSGTQITEINFPENLTTIGANAFYCVPLKSLYIPKSVNYIGNFAFAGDEYEKNSQSGSGSGEISIIGVVPGSGTESQNNYTSISGMAGVSFIGQYAFAYSYLTSFEIPEKLTQLHKGVIRGTDITEINLENSSLTFIGDYAFENSNLTSVSIPSNVTTIGDGICKNCTDLETAVLPELSHARIPAEIFAGCTKLTNVTIPEGITSVGEYAFDGCESMNNLVLSDTVRTVGEYAFNGCSNLSTITIPAHLATINKYAFSGTPIKEANFSDDLRFVKDGAFENCENLEIVTFKEGVIYIGEDAFKGCSLLKELELPDSISYIGDFFIEGSGVEKVYLPSSLNSLPAFTGNATIKEIYCESTEFDCIMAGSFENCTALEVCELSSCGRIESYAFVGCENLKSFVAQDAEYINYRAFYGCTSLTSFICCGDDECALENIYEEAFYGCSSLIYFEMGNNVTGISDSAFEGCSSLEELKLSPALKKIGSCAFRQSGIKSLIIGRYVRDISVGYSEEYNLQRKMSCFYDMPKLETVVFLDQMLGNLSIEDAFLYDPMLSKVYMPSSVGAVGSLNGIATTYSLLEPVTDWYGDIIYDEYGYTYYGDFDYDALDANGSKAPIAEDYEASLLPDYVGTTYIRYGDYEKNEPISDENYLTVYKPDDKFVALNFSSDYDIFKDYYDSFEACLEKYNMEVPELNDYLLSMNALSDYKVKVMADGEDITDKVEINWYVDWLEDNVIATGASLAGFAWTHPDFRYSFTVKLTDDYAFEYEDYSSEEFVLITSDDGAERVVNLTKRPESTVNIHIPEDIKNNATLTVMQTVDGKIRTLDVTVAEGIATVETSSDANLLIYCTANGYYRYSGGIDGNLLGDEPYDFFIEMKALPESSSFCAKFNILDILPDEIAGDGTKEQLTELGSFDNISAKVTNKTTGAETTEVTLSYPYVTIENFDAFYTQGDELEITLIPDDTAEFYGMTATLLPGTNTYGSTEGNLNGYSTLYFTPTLPEDSTTGKAIVQVYDLLGNRVGVDTVASGEMLIRRYKDGIYRLTAFEQNNFIGEMEKLSSFTSIGWTEEEYYLEEITLEAPNGKYITADVPLAPDASDLLKTKCTVTKKDEEYYRAKSDATPSRVEEVDGVMVFIPGGQPESIGEQWFFTSSLRFRGELEEFGMKNAKLLLSVPSVYSVQAFYRMTEYSEGKNNTVKLIGEEVSADGETTVYTYDASFMETNPEINFFVAVQASNETPIETLQNVGLFSLALRCDATLEEETKTVTIGLGSVSAVNTMLLEDSIRVNHAENVSTKNGIPVEVQAPAFSNVELYADDVLVATGRTNYAGIAVFKYDAPFEWLWWQYDVYAVISFGNTKLTTNSISVTCHVDTTEPTEVSAEFVIIDNETDEVVFPTAGDNKNTVSINYETGARENVAIRKALTEGKEYKVIRTFTAKFNNAAKNSTNNVSILWDYTNSNNVTVEKILSAEYDKAANSYYTETSETFVYSPANMLFDLKIPTELGVQWENINSTNYVMLPGQLAALMKKNTSKDLKGTFAEARIASLNEEVSEMPLFKYFPAKMQADLLKTQSILQECYADTENLVENVYGLSAEDFSADDISAIAQGMLQDTFEPTDELAGALRNQGYLEYPILGMDNGLFVSKADGIYEIYDFSDGTHIHYSTTLLWDMLSEKHNLKEAQGKAESQLLNASYEITDTSLDKYIDDYQMIYNYDSTLFSKLYVLNGMDKKTEEGKQLYESITIALTEYNDVLYRIHDVLQDFVDYEAKYGREFYEDYLEGSVLMEGFDLLNSTLGGAIASVLEFAGFESDSTNLLIENFVDNDTGKVVLDVNRNAGLQANEQGVGVLVTEVKSLGTNAAGESIGWGITKASDVKITQQWDITKEAIMEISQTEEILKGTSKLEFINDLGGEAVTPETEFINNSEAMKKGLIIKTESTGVKTAIEGSGVDYVVKEVGTTRITTYMSADSRANKSVRNVLIDYQNEKIEIAQAEIKNIKAGKKVAEDVMEVGGKAVEIVALVDTATSLYRDLDGQVDALNNMLKSYSNVILSTLEYAEVYETYADMVYAINHDTDDRESFTLLPTTNKETLLAVYDSMDVSFESGTMNKTTFAELYAGQAFYWSIPANVKTQNYKDPETGEKVEFKGYFPCNMSNSIGAPIKKVYYSDDKTNGKEYEEYVKKCKQYSKEAVTALCNLSEEYYTSANKQMDTFVLSFIELLPIGLVATAAKGIQAAVESIDSLNYLLYQDQIIMDTALLEASEDMLVTLRTLIQARNDCKTEIVDVRGTERKVTYVTFNSAKKRWENFCRNNWKYDYYYENSKGKATGKTKKVVLTNFPSGHPMGENYTLDYKGEVQFPDYTWKYFSYSVDSYGAIRGCSLEEYGYRETENWISKTVSSYTTTIQWKSHCQDPQIDPAGFIYEAVLSNRVQGATATLYTADNNGNEVLWDGSDYEELNPQITDVEGYYSWLTPQGLWKVRVEKDGYLPASSENNANAVDGWLPVPPPQLDINIGLVSTEVPTVESIIGYTDGIDIIFSQYMDIESVEGKVTLLVDGESVECVLNFTDREQAGSGEDVYYGKTLNVRRTDGQALSDDVKISIDGTAKNYAGTALGENFTSESLTLNQRAATVKFAQGSYYVAEADTYNVTGRILDSNGLPMAEAEVTLSISSGNSATLQNIYVFTDDDGLFSFGIKGESIGSTYIKAVCGNAEKTICVNTVANETSTKSSQAFVTVEKPDGSIEEITASGHIVVPEGSKLYFDSYVGSAEYSTNQSQLDPWWSDDFTGDSSNVTAEEKTYRIVVREYDKNYSDVLELTVEFSEEETVLPGDINGDGKINTLDVTWLLNHVLAPSLYKIYADGDTDRNGSIDAADVIYLLNHVVNPSLYPLE